MGFGMARKAAGKNVERACGLALALTAALAFAQASAAQESAPPEAPPPLSPACEAPAGDIAAPALLPHFAKALRERKSARILAIGSSST